MRKTKLWMALALAAFVSALLTPAFAQEQTGKVHGHIQDPAGVAITDGVVTLSTDGGKTAKYTFNSDASGEYKGDGIAPGTYTLSLRRPDTPADKVLDQFPEVKIAAGADTRAGLRPDPSGLRIEAHPRAEKNARRLEGEERLGPEGKLGHQESER